MSRSIAAKENQKVESREAVAALDQCSWWSRHTTVSVSPGHKSHVMSRNKFPLLKQRQNEIARQLEWPEEIERGRPTVVTVIGLINFRAGCEETVRKRSLGPLMERQIHKNG